MALTQPELQSIVQLIRHDPEVRRQFQAALQLNGLLDTPNRMAQIEAAIAQLVEAQRQSEDRLRRAETRLEKVEARLERIEGIVEKLAEAQLRTEAALHKVEDEVAKMSDRLRGEEGRRAGEQYERTLERRAPSLLGGGVGGSAQRDIVYTHAQQLLAPLYPMDDLPSEADPMLADIVWWKSNRYVVVEVSLRVDRLDVLRAAQRARTLRQAGADATGIVIGDEWLAEDTLELARSEKVEWKVGNGYSTGLLAYRRLAA